jgi:outer membrane protein OmpA-like peptidoglycan-associated protein/opacity protein-like surface antigen
MYRFGTLAIVTACIVCLGAVAAAGPVDDRWAIGVEGGIWKLTEGYWDHSNVDEFAGLSLRKGLSPNWTMELGLRIGSVRPGVGDPNCSAGWTFDDYLNLTTEIYNPLLMMEYQISPDSRFTPFLGLGVGATRWRVIATTADHTFFPEGTTVQGFGNDDDEYHKLSATNVTVAAELGVEWWLRESMSLRLGGRYNVLLSNDLDNIGWSSWNATRNPEYVDANSALVEGFVSLSFWFGSADTDRDGLPNADDGCPDLAEDFDGFEDQDGCPDPDNDRDTIADLYDKCPDLAEDLDGFQDEDGCPDPDNDRDLILDVNDKCPDQPEDMDGYADEDGCPDPDNDGDGVPDSADACPDTPTGTPVGVDGCPAKAAPRAVVPPVETMPAIGQGLVLDGVSFKSGSAELLPESIAVLARVANSLVQNPTAIIEVRGHTDAQGAAEINRDLSQRRAIAVREVLVQMGVPSTRITAVGYGEDQPIADNATAEGRAKNRRVEMQRVGG